MKRLFLLAGAITFVSSPVFAASLNLNLGLTRPLTSVAGAVVGGATNVATGAVGQVGSGVGQVALGVGADLTQGSTTRRAAALVGRVVGVNTATFSLSEVSRSGDADFSPADRRRYARSAPLVQFGASSSLLSN